MDTKDNKSESSNDRELILGTFWFAIYNLVNVHNADSFLEVGWAFFGYPHSAGYVPLLQHGYLGTTLGYGDIVPLSPAARMLPLWNRRQAFSHNSKFFLRIPYQEPLPPVKLE